MQDETKEAQEGSEYLGDDVRDRFLESVRHGPVDNPEAAINQPDWTDEAVRESVITEGPNIGHLTKKAAERHGSYINRDSRQMGEEAAREGAEHTEFFETVEKAVNSNAWFFCNPEITDEEALKRLTWARGRAKAAVDKAKLIQKTANEARKTENPQG